jgi:acetyl-CoA carboxylase carboxyltransferase component
MTWEPELEELRRREELARRMGGQERVERQHASGRLTVRERIERLFDPGTFHETGALAGRATYGESGELTDFLPANTVVGQGRVDGRRAVVQGDDFTVRGGAADAAIWEKAVYAERLAHDLRLPLLRLVDGTGGGGSVKSLEQMGSPTCRRCRASTWSSRTSRSSPWWPRRSGRWPGWVRRGWCARTSR